MHNNYNPNQRKKTQVTPFGKRFARAQYKWLISTKKDRKQSYFKIKTSLTFPELCDAADFIEKNVDSKNQDQLYGNPLPQSYSELGTCERIYTSDFFNDEINWLLLSIRKYSYQINLFLAYKEIYETNLLLGQYDDAEKYLDKIETEICHSLWSLENRFLLKEVNGASIENKEFLSRFNEQNTSTGYTKPLAHYLSLRAEKTLSVTRFNSDLELALSRMQGLKNKEHAEYYFFKLSFLNHINFNYHAEILAYDFQHSVVDKYLTLRKVLTNLLTTTVSQSSEKNRNESLRTYVLNRINYLLRKIKDPILSKLKLLSHTSLFAAFDTDESKLEISIIDKYTTGYFAEAEQDLSELLLKKPLQFDLYHLYVKSLIYQKKTIKSIGNETSLQNQILAEMYKIVSVTVNPLEGATTLLRIANNIAGCILSYALTDFVFFQTKGREERKLLAKLAFNPANPIVSETYPDKASKIRYLSFLKAKFPNSITVDFLLNKIEHVENFSAFERSLPTVKYKTEVAKSLQKKREYMGAAEIWEHLIEEYRETVPIYETAITYLFDCYFELRKYDDCISLFVNSYFYNNFIVSKIDVKPLLDRIRENRFRIVNANIDLPVFYTIVSADENEIHTAFEKFNLTWGACKPSELLSNFDSFDRNKMVFYLTHTCSQEILKHSIHINGSKERLEERLALCKFLSEVDNAKKASHDDEIKSITNILIIQKGLLELDESKIYVNELGIISNELKDLEAVFSRFKSIAKITEKKNVFLLDKKGRLTFLTYGEEPDSVEKIQYSGNPLYDIYKELFDEIKEKFLHSKFGIVAYLSTRIRHGVLLGEIRPIFEKHHLITQKEGESSSYKKNVYWEAYYYYYPAPTQAKIQELLRDFSYSIDGLIFDLIKKYLQVYDKDKNPEGWFDYDFADEDLYWHSFKGALAKDFNHFAKDVFEILWIKTDVNLEIIRQKIRGDISKQFNDLFDGLEKEVVELLGWESAQNLITQIKACSTETQTSIHRISSWFKRSGTQTNDFKVDNLVDIVMEHANKTFRNRKINLERHFSFGGTIKGEFYTHFADLLRIFFENILKHADESANIVDSRIIIESIEDQLHIEVSNQVTNLASVQALKHVGIGEKIDVKKLLSEGKSGLHKANKIVKSDFKNEKNTIYTAENTQEQSFAVGVYISIPEISI